MLFILCNSASNAKKRKLGEGSYTFDRFHASTDEVVCSPDNKEITYKIRSQNLPKEAIDDEVSLKTKDGEETSCKFKKEPNEYFLVLLTCKIPGNNGIELKENDNEAESKSGLKIIFNMYNPRRMCGDGSGKNEPEKKDPPEPITPPKPEKVKCPHKCKECSDSDTCTKCHPHSLLLDGKCVDCAVKFFGCRECDEKECKKCHPKFGPGKDGNCGMPKKLGPPIFRLAGFGRFLFLSKGFSFRVYFNLFQGIMINAKIHIVIIIGRGKKVTVTCNQEGAAGMAEEPSGADNLANLLCSTEEKVEEGTAINVGDIEMLEVNGEEAEEVEVTVEKKMLEVDLTTQTGTEIEEAAEAKGKLLSFTTSSEESTCSADRKKVTLALTSSFDITEELENEYKLKTEDDKEISCVLKKAKDSQDATLECETPKIGAEGLKIKKEQEVTLDGTTLELALTDDDALCGVNVPGESESEPDETTDEPEESSDVSDEPEKDEPEKDEPDVPEEDEPDEPEKDEPDEPEKDEPEKDEPNEPEKDEPDEPEKDVSDEPEKDVSDEPEKDEPENDEPELDEPEKDEPVSKSLEPESESEEELNCPELFIGCNENECTKKECLKCSRLFSKKGGKCEKPAGGLPVPKFKLAGFGRFEVGLHGHFPIFSMYFNLVFGVMFQVKIKFTLVIKVNGRVLEQSVSGLCQQNGVAGFEEEPTAFGNLARLDCNSGDAGRDLTGIELNIKNPQITDMNGEPVPEGSGAIVDDSGLLDKDISQYTGTALEDEYKKKGKLYSFTPSDSTKPTCSNSNNLNTVEFTGSVPVSKELNNKYELVTKDGDKAKCNLKHTKDADNASLVCTSSNSKGFSFESYPEGTNTDGGEASTLSLVMEENSTPLCAQAQETNKGKNDGDGAIYSSGSSKSSSGGLSGGAIAAIVIAAVVVVGIIAGIIAYCLYNGSKHERFETTTSERSLNVIN